MTIFIFSIWLLFTLQSGVDGEYSVKKTVKETGGPIYHVSKLRLNLDKSYLYTDAAFDKSGQVVSADTIKGEWYLVGDTLITKNYNVKWLVRKKSLIKLASVRLTYRKQ